MCVCYNFNSNHSLPPPKKRRSTTFASNAKCQICQTCLEGRNARTTLLCLKFLVFSGITLVSCALCVQGVIRLLAWLLGFVPFIFLWLAPRHWAKKTSCTLSILPCTARLGVCGCDFLVFLLIVRIVVGLCGVCIQYVECRSIIVPTPFHLLSVEYNTPTAPQHQRQQQQQGRRDAEKNHTYIYVPNPRCSKTQSHHHKKIIHVNIKYALRSPKKRKKKPPPRQRTWGEETGRRLPIRIHTHANTESQPPVIVVVVVGPYLQIITCWHRLIPSHGRHGSTHVLYFFFSFHISFLSPSRAGYVECSCFFFFFILVIMFLGSDCRWICTRDWLGDRVHSTMEDGYFGRE